MSQALRKLGGNVSQANYDLHLHNQLREKIGVMFGNPETTPGGRALKFWSSVRLEVRRVETLKQGDDGDRQPRAREGGEEQGRAAVQAGGVRHHVRQGHLREGTVLDAASSARSSTKSGTCFSYGDERLGQGRQNATAFLEEHPDVVQQILAGIQAQAPPDQTVSARLVTQPEPVAAGPSPVEAEEEPATAA